MIIQSDERPSSSVGPSSFFATNSVSTGCTTLAACNGVVETAAACALTTQQQPQTARTNAAARLILRMRTT
jgi:hypothetical protein